MELQEEILIPAPRDKVYAALNDTEVLKACIPGCEELIRHSDTELEAKVVLKIGPVKARFGGNVVLDQSQAPAAFSLTGEGTGGAAGFAKGGADVTLEDRGEETLLTYTAKAEVGGKIAQLGSRLVLSTSKKLAGKFFKNLQDELSPEQAQTAG
ncbi:CoxG family protein [Tropicimonas aquimaris]|uniref:CoxG family protein n=1 Tax=Tropicimonas aquimaris TaxID=914152 RepID=A0ABW3IJW8_9RHOB